MNTLNRDKFLCQDYQDGKEINELARTYGLTDRRVSQILKDRGVPRRVRNPSLKKPLSQVHTRIGLHLYNYRFNNKTEVGEASIDLGWSPIKLRKVERGIRDVEVLDLMDIASYTKTPLSELLEKKNN